MQIPEDDSIVETASRYRVFVLPDGREIYVDPAAVSCVYDQPWPEGRDPKAWSPIPSPSTAVVAVGHTNLVVPYTAAQVLEILHG